jgi:hypothetical protein
LRIVRLLFPVHAAPPYIIGRFLTASRKTQVARSRILFDPSNVKVAVVIAVKSNADGLQVDLRLNWKQAASSIVAAAKELGSNGEASLAVLDDKHEGAAASVVVTDASGRVLDSNPTTVGEDA